MNLNEEMPEEIVLLTNCFNEFVNIGLISKFNNPFTDIMDDGTIQFKKVGRSSDYSLALDECMKNFKEFTDSKITESIPVVKDSNFVSTTPVLLAPIEYIKERVRVSAEELYNIYNLDTRSKRTIMSNTLCKNNTGIIKRKSNGKLYFLYQQPETNNKG